MKTLATKALVLGRINYGEADKILTLLTQDKGKLSVIAKGVRKPKSKVAGGIELFTINDITYIEGKSDLKTLVSARVHEHYGNIVKNLATVQAAYDIILYANLFTESECENDFYEVTKQALQALHAAVPTAVVVVWFGLRLLHISGHAINTEVSYTNQQSDLYVFDHKEMTFYQHPSGAYTKNHIKVVRICISSGIETVKNVQNIQQYCSDMQQDIVKTLKTYSTKNL
jgi:DNA repair protein RecO (recombination protein O)